MLAWLFHLIPCLCLVYLTVGVECFDDSNSRDTKQLQSFYRRETVDRASIINYHTLVGETGYYARASTGIITPFLLLTGSYVSYVLVRAAFCSRAMPAPLGLSAGGRPRARSISVVRTVHMRQEIGWGKRNCTSGHKKCDRSAVALLEKNVDVARCRSYEL